MIGMIAAVAPDGLIGCAGKIPWHYPLDLKFFKETTAGSTVIMGRKTWDSLPPKFRPLPNRQNLVVTRRDPNHAFLPQLEGLTSEAHCSSMEVALERASTGKDVWIIGGAEIYFLGMPFATQLCLTLVPSIAGSLRAVINPTDPVYFPFISPKIWRDKLCEHPDTRLTVARYWRKTDS